jgi:hypothetical protein
MTLTGAIVHIKADWLRVPIWSLWFPLYLLPDFIIYSLVRKEGRARMVQAECWRFMFAVYISGIDGWDAE